MPRPRRSSSERRRFERERKASWRQQIPTQTALTEQPARQLAGAFSHVEYTPARGVVPLNPPAPATVQAGHAPGSLRPLYAQAGPSQPFSAPKGAPQIPHGPSQSLSQAGSPLRQRRTLLASQLPPILHPNGIERETESVDPYYKNDHESAASLRLSSPNTVIGQERASLSSAADPH